MPIIQSAIKKLRKDRKREKLNKVTKARLKDTIKKAEKSRKENDIRKAVSLIDKAAKTHIIHTNKAARLKSSLAKLVFQKQEQKTPRKPAGRTQKRLGKAEKKLPAKPS